MQPLQSIPTVNNKGKVFCSYSRKDSAFVLKLAKDLKYKGIELWIDQFGIKAGNRWDTSIETALNSASHFIVCLSPASVNNNNVLDEVSFALENGKTVIPILISKCVVPFRLQRLQRIDFIDDYKIGLNSLLEILNDNTDIRTEEITTGHVRRKYTFWVGGFVLTGLITWLIVSLSSRNENDKNAWDNAFNKNDSSAYALYLQAFPNGNYSKEAKVKIDSIAKYISDLKTQALKDSDTFKESTALTERQTSNKIIESQPANTVAVGKDSFKAAGKNLSTKKQPAVEHNIYENNDESNITIGGKYQGGIIFHIDKYGKHGLIAAPYDQSTGIQWWGYYGRDTLETLTTSNFFGSGKYNTKAIVSLEDPLRSDTNYAARLCFKLDLNGYRDWYLPSKDELDTLISKINLINGLDRNAAYWSSSGSAYGAWTIHARDGSKNLYSLRIDQVHVRAIRSF